jgi:acetolactate synthase-1/2/3 large subunit
MKENISNQSLADYIANFLHEEKIGVIYQLSGGMIAFLADAIHRLGKTKIINLRHEQAAGFAAEGSSRVLNYPSFVMATSGPGATNLVTAIASCYFDSSPVVFITGQVNTKELRKNRKQRQNGFQELDIVNLVKGITKATFSPNSPEDVVKALISSIQISNSGRKGPVLIDIPIDLQQAKLNKLKNFNHGKVSRKNVTNLHSKFSKLEKMYRKSKSPLILVGAGIRASNSRNELNSFLNETEIPVVSSLMGLDTISHSSKSYLGFIGSYGNRWANKALSDCDLLITIGSRLDVRQTGNSVENFVKGKKIIRVDVDKHELNGRIKSDLKFQMPIEEFMVKLNNLKLPKKFNPLVASAQTIKSQFPQEKENPSSVDFNPNLIMNKLSDIFSYTNGYIVDVGQHQMWAAQSIKLNKNQRFLTSGGLGSMGFALPAAIGASTSTSGRWVAIMGDGCAQLVTPELETVVQNKLNIVVCVFNNAQHGMVSQFQDENMESRYVGTRDGYSVPNFTKLAEVYGFKKIFKIKSDFEFDSIISELGPNSTEPIFIEFVIPSTAKALPKLKN